MKLYICVAALLVLFSGMAHGKEESPVRLIAKEPVTMMDLGILKLNTSMARPTQPGLQGATISAKYNSTKGTIDIKVSKPVSKASKSECSTLITNTKDVFVKTYDKKKVSNIHYFFEHEGTGYSRSIDWNDLPKFVVITGVVLTGKNYQDSVYCQSNLFDEKITFQ
jgi:hypothetical protein